ncbi:response regulator [Desulfovibrio aminophilus]|nr:response regulator [Desulfovibrio aminophilus]MCM0755783.1 response regulator [Desulfovibrio aminophilus]
MDVKDWKILLVDDEVEFVSTLAERLELRGMSPRLAHDGESALKAVAQDPPQVMVLDVMMPGMKGLDVLRRVKESHPKVQVILLTGQGKTRDGIEGMKLGAFFYMMKPLDLDELIAKLGEAVAAGGGA